MPITLGIHGPALSGKDTFADYLIEKKGWAAKLSFAANLKRMCQRIFDLSDFDVQDQEGKKTPFNSPKALTQTELNSILVWMSRTHGKCQPVKDSDTKIKSLLGTELYTPRDVLQLVGTDVCRTLIPSYHLDILTLHLNEFSNTSRVVITDVRFPNEGDLIKDHFEGKVIRLVREEALSTTGVNRSHASETSMSKWGRFDEVIENNDEGLDSLYLKIDSFLERNESWHATGLLEGTETESSSVTEETETPRSTGTAPVTS